MKTKILITLLSLSITTFVNAQLKDTSASKMSDHDLGMLYLQRSKSQKTTAWVLLGVGVAGWIGGTIAYNNAWEDWDLSDSNPGTGAEIVTYIGFGCTIASVPIFIGAAKNKGRAEILLRNENIMIGYKPERSQSLPAIGISIPLNSR